MEDIFSTFMPMAANQPEASLFTSNNNSNKDDFLRIIDTLNNAEDVLNENDNAMDFLFESVAEPVPINPNGINRVVQQVPINTFQWNADGDEIRHLLEPLIKEEQKPQEPQTEDNLFSFQTFSVPRNIYKRRCLEFPEKIDEFSSGEKKKSFYVPSSGALISFNDNSTNDPSANFIPSITQEQLQKEAKGMIRSYQSDQWTDRFQDLMDFKATYGHCLVPHSFPPNQKLAQWVKRQRYQHKLKQMKRHCTLTDDRELQLSSIGFVWDSHKASWSERIQSLQQFKAIHGHCNVPSNYEDKTLAVWVKCQRRQYKLFKKGQRSTMTEKRFRDLVNVGFDWDPRHLES